MSNGMQKLSCEQVRSYLDSYEGDELLVETNHKMQAHLEDCRGCSAELEERKRMKNLLRRAVQAEVAPASLRAKIHSQTHESRPAYPFALTNQRMAIAASLAVILGLGTWGAVSIWSGSRNVAATLTSESNPTLSEAAMRVLDIGLGDHVHCAIDNNLNVRYVGLKTSELGGEYAALIPVVREHVGANFEVISAHNCFVGEREFTHLILEDRTAIVSVVITKRLGEEFPANDRFAYVEKSGTQLYSGRTPDYAVTGFEAGEHLAFVASNLNESENLRIASQVAPVLLTLNIQ